MIDAFSLIQDFGFHTLMYHSVPRLSAGFERFCGHGCRCIEPRDVKAALQDKIRVKSILRRGML